MKLEPCLPPWWAPEGHSQTVLGHLLPSPRLTQTGRRVELPLADHDKLILFVHEGGSPVVVYLFHGLAGSTDSNYMHRSALLALRAGHSVVMVNHRGCGAGVGLARGPYHCGRAEDLSAAIEWGREHFARKRHLAVGFSMSGNALLLLLAGVRGSHKPDAAITLNAPIEIERTALSLRRGFNRIYDAKFYWQCRRDVLLNRVGDGLEKKLPRLIALHDFDNLFTAPAGGFRNREDYYHSCSTRDLLSQVDVPTISFTTQNDPFVPWESYAGARFSASLELHVEEHGGHMGYLSRDKTPLGTRRWQDYALGEAIQILA